MDDFRSLGVLSAETDWHSRGYLPHIENRQLQSIAYRLYDSVPNDVIQQWQNELQITEKTTPNAPELQELRKRMDKYEDAGYGQCFLKDDRVASVVQNNLLYFDNIRYLLHSWCIMPNHVHILMEVKEGWTLSEIMHGWRSYTAKTANKILERTGDFWQKEYLDRFIRNEEHYKNVVEYINNNPVKAGLVTDAKMWKWCSFYMVNVTNAK